MIENKLESDARLSASVSPPMDLADQFPQSSPFGPLNLTSSRKTYSYLLATLNASHPDHEFSSILRPDHFSKERSLIAVMNRFNTALFNLGRVIPNFWETIDLEMDLRDCAIYVCEPDSIDDPYTAEGLLWKLMYFFHNKHKKRVCYLYLRAISKSSHSHQNRAMEAWRKEADDNDEYWGSETESLWATPGSDVDEFVEQMEI